MFRLSSRYASLLFLALVSTAHPSHADTITGRVVDANGVGVPGVDIDVKNLGSGGDPLITNDGTNLGGFFTTTLPAGVYEVFFKPPPPPLTSLLTNSVINVVVVGTKDMGVITLATGVVMSGRVIDSAGIPVANLSVNVTDVATGDLLVIKSGNTNAFGNFSVAVPTRAITLDLDPIGIIGRTLAPQRFSMTPALDTNLGDITLVNGFILSGTFRNSLGAGVPNVDVDVFDSITGVKVFTPHDGSNSLGQVSMVVAPGTYDVEASPTFASHLVAIRVNGLSLQANLNTGITTLENGVVLTGRVRDVNGLRLAGIDVDVHRVPGGKVITNNDDTNDLGRYSVIVPRATLNVGFAFPDQHGTSGEDLHSGLVVTANAVLDGVLPRPLAEFTGAPTAGASPLLVSFQDQSTGAVRGWSWDFGDGSPLSTLQNPSHTYTTGGTFAVKLTVSGPGGPNTRTRLGFVVVTGPPPPPPVAGFIGSPTAGLSPLTVKFTNQSTGVITSHLWNWGDGTATSALLSPTHIYKKLGTFTVTLTETGPGGPNTLTRPAYIVVNAAPPVAAFTAAPTSGAAPLTVVFTNQSTGFISSHLWNFGDGKTAIAKNPTHIYGANGTYTVMLTETGPGGTGTVTKVGFIRVPGP